MIYRHMNGKVDAAKKQDIQGNEAYLMFSMTKVQTMIAIMQLVEQGKVSLEDEVSKYLPAYSDLCIMENGKIVSCKSPILLKHLVSMQSGLDYDLNQVGILRVLKEKGQAASTREIVDSFVKKPLSFVSGTRFQYSLSHDVVAAIIEVVSGMSFGEYLKEHIWKPLGMEHTFFAKHKNDHINNLAAQYICDDNGKNKLMDSSCVYQLSENYESGGAGLVSCTEDYAVFADAIACGGVGKNGKQIIKPDTIELMKQNLLGEASMKDIAQNMGRPGYGYGCGVQVLVDQNKAHATAPAGVFGLGG